MPGSAGVQDLGIEEAQSSGSYTLAQVRLHWAVAALVTIQLFVGLRIWTLTDAAANQPALSQVFVIHAVIGTVIFALMVVRLRLRRRVGVPPPPMGTPYDAAVLARINHYGFYGVLLVMPVIGWLAYLAGGGAGADFFGSLHGALALVLVLAIGAHIGGVIYHSDVRGDEVPSRMAVAKPQPSVDDTASSTKQS